jgi:hypothetical protein
VTPTADNLEQELAQAEEKLRGEIAVEVKQEIQIDHPFSKVVMQAIHDISGKLMRHEKGTKVELKWLQEQMGELMSNYSVLENEMQQAGEPDEEQDASAAGAKRKVGACSQLVCCTAPHPFEAQMPLRLKKQKAERRRAQFWAAMLELFNEAGDIAFLFKLYKLSKLYLYYTSLSFLLLSLVGRLATSMILRSQHGVKKGKEGVFLMGMGVYLVEPNSGHEIMKRALQDKEQGGKVWDSSKGKFEASTKDPVAVQAHIDYSAGKAEIRSICIMVLGEDLPEFIIELIYLFVGGEEREEMDTVFWVSVVGTLLHMGFQLRELSITRGSLPELQRLAEGRNKVFVSESTTDESVKEFAVRYGSVTKKVSLRDCRAITDGAVEVLAKHCTGLHTIVLAECSADGAVEALAKHCTGLQEIYLTRCSAITDGAVEVLAKHCTGLQGIDLNVCSAITDGAVKALAKHCTALQKIGLSGCSAITDGAIEALAKHCTGLQYIKLSECSAITDGAVEALAKHCTGLQTIDLSYCSAITDGAIEALAKHCTSLQTIYLSSCSAITDGAIEVLAKHCTGLQYIKLSKCSAITDGAVEALAKHCTGLHTIDLSSCSAITDGAIEVLAKHCTGLHEIRLSSCSAITDGAVEVLAKHCTGLQWIDLSKCSAITDGAIEALAKHCTGLQEIDLSSCSAITDGAIEALAKHCTSLHTIDLSSCSAITDGAITDGAIEALQRSNSGLEVKKDGC